MERAFIVQLDTGEQLGPLDEEALKRLAEEGRIPEDAEVRSTMLAIWEKAKDVECLKKIYRARMLERAEAYAQDPKAQLRARIEMRGDYDPLANALSQEGITYHETSFFWRFVAGLTDLLVLAVSSFILLFICWGLMKGGILGGHAALLLYCALAWGGSALYYMYFLSERGQTVGQHFWGLVTITPDFRKVYPIKAFLFFLLTACFGILSPVTWLLFGCRYTLQERVPGVMVKRISVARKTY